MIKNLNNKIFLSFSIITVINYILFTQRIIFRNNPYITADWLINYQGGFVRRGFFGEIIYQINFFTKIDILHLVIFFNIIVIILFFYLLYNIIKKSLFNKLFLIYCLIPSTILFTFFDPLAVGRKDYLSILPYLFYGYFINKLTINIKVSLISALIILTLTHELTFFFVPFLFLFKSANFLNLSLNYQNYKFEIICSIATFLTLLSTMIFKVPFNNEICQSLVDLNLNKEICNGVIRDFSNPSTFSLDLIYNNLKYLNNFNYYSQYSIYIILSYLPICILFYKPIINGNLSYQYIIFFIISFLFLTPLILLTNDWGRYLNMLFILHIIYFHFLIKNLSIGNINLSLFKKVLIVPIIFIYLTSWHMPHCCQKAIGSGYIYIIERIIFRINDETNETHKYGKDKPREILKKIINFF